MKKEKEVVMVTGASGYIGQHVIKAINAKFPDHEVVGVDHPASNHSWDWGFDLVDPHAVQFAVEQINPTVVIHLAALCRVDEAERQPGAYYATNVQGTINLCEALETVGCKHLVFASSAAARTRSGVYGWTKAVGEMVLESFTLPTTSLRFFNVAGKQHLSTTHVVPNLARSLGADSPFTVTADPETTVRDFIHVEDVANAAVAFIGVVPFRSTVYEIGTGVGTSLGDLFAMFEQITGQRLKYERAKNRQGDPTALVACPKAMPVPHVWKPTRTLKNIVHSALAAEGWDRSTGRWFA